MDREKARMMADLILEGCRRRCDDRPEVDTAVESARPMAKHIMDAIFELDAKDKRIAYLTETVEFAEGEGMGWHESGCYSEMIVHKDRLKHCQTLGPAMCICSDGGPWGRAAKRGEQDLAKLRADLDDRDVSLRAIMESIATLADEVDKLDRMMPGSGLILSAANWARLRSAIRMMAGKRDGE